MRAGKIVLWVFIAMVISGVVFGIGLVTDVIKMGGWDKTVFGVGKQYDVNDVKELDLANAKRIEITVTSSDTNILEATGGKVKAALTGRVRTTQPGAVPTLEARQSGDVIYISEKRQTMMTIGFYSSEVKLDVSIPSDFKGDVVFKGSSSDFTARDRSFSSLNVFVSSGDVEIQNLKLQNELIMAASSGDMTVRNVEAPGASIETSSGDKEIYDLHVAGNVKLNANSGQTKIDGIKCRDFSIESTSGDMVINNLVSDSLTAQGSSSNITVKGVEGSAKIRTTSGDIDLQMKNPKNEINIEASSGNVRLGLPESTGFRLNTQVSSGNISCRVALSDKNSDDHHLSGTAGSGELPVSITTTSGNIEIFRN